MTNEVISPQGVHIAGDFQSIAGLGGNLSPSITEIMDNNRDGLYSITVQIPDNTYEYKFINGNDWGMDESPPAECSVGPTNNRSLTVNRSNLTLPAVSFNGCLPTVNFSINLQNQIISTDGIYIMGDFQEAAGFSHNWDPGITQIQDLNADKTYDLVLIFRKEIMSIYF